MKMVDSFVCNYICTYKYDYCVAMQVCVHTCVLVCMYVPWCYMMTKIASLVDNKIVRNNEVVSSNFSKDITIAIADFV